MDRVKERLDDGMKALATLEKTVQSKAYKATR